MRPDGVVLLHGYGVRSGIWEEIRAGLSSRFNLVRAPDLEASSIDDLIAMATRELESSAAACGTPLAAVGHSLGAVVAAVAAQRLGREIVSHLVLLAPPYGSEHQSQHRLIRFLLRHRLIPQSLVLPRFFSSLTPKEIQRQIFRRAAPEHPDLRAVTLDRPWFHVPLFQAPLGAHAIVIASESDRIVSHHQSEAFARAIGAEFVILPRSRGVAHDDLFASPMIAQEIAGRVVEFCQ
jgi:predicted alpha/beta hydrolase family esterase